MAAVQWPVMITEQKAIGLGLGKTASDGGVAQFDYPLSFYYLSTYVHWVVGCPISAVILGMGVWLGTGALCRAS